MRGAPVPASHYSAHYKFLMMMIDDGICFMCDNAAIGCCLSQD